MFANMAKNLIKSSSQPIWMDSKQNSLLQTEALDVTHLARAH